MKDGIMRQHLFFSLLEVGGHLTSLCFLGAESGCRMAMWPLRSAGQKRGVWSNQCFLSQWGNWASWLWINIFCPSLFLLFLTSGFLLFVCLFVLFLKRIVGAHLEIRPSLMETLYYYFFYLPSPRFESPRAKNLLTCWVCSKTNHSSFTRTGHQRAEGRHLLPPRASFKSGETWHRSPGLWR